MADISLSVIIPTYNRRDILKSCIDALLNQKCSFSSYEIIIIDDGSTDDTKELVRAMPNDSVRYLRQENKGPAAARNIGIKNAKGKIILFLGDDIIASPNLLEQHYNWHKKYPADNIAVLGYITWSSQLAITPFMRWLEQGGNQFDYYQIKDSIDVDIAKYFYSSNLSLKKDFLLGNNALFDEDFPYAVFEDIELGNRLKKLGMVLKYNQEAVAYHYHPTTLKDSCNRMIKVGEYSQILKKKINNFNQIPLADCLSDNFFLRFKRYFSSRIYYLLALFYEKRRIKEHIYRKVLEYYYFQGIRSYYCSQANRAILGKLRTVIRRIIFYCLNTIIKIPIFLVIFNHLYERLPYNIVNIIVIYIRIPNQDLNWMLKLINNKKVITKIYKDKPWTWQIALTYRWHHNINVFEAILNQYYDISVPYVDIGANLGLRSLNALSVGRPVFMIEPNKELNLLNQIRCQENKFNSYKIFDYCISSIEGEAIFYFDKTSFQSTLNQGLLLPDNIIKAEKVKLRTLDVFANEYLSGFNKAFVKIDVEGHEFEVIKGGYNFLSKTNPTLLVEINEKGRHIYEIFDFMKKLDYDILELRQKPREINFEPTQNSCMDNILFQSNDFIFTKDKKLKELLLKFNIKLYD